METIQKLITDSVNKHRHNRALWVNDRYYSYDELNFYSDKYIEVLSRYQNQNVCILLEKNIFCYGAILALFKDGRTYVPLNIKYSDYRNTQIVNHSKAQVLITEKRFASKVARIISPENRSSTEVIFSEDYFKSSHNDYSSSRDKHVETSQVDIFKNHKKDYICYLLFTSGTTGEPKGVPISSNNLVSYLENISLQYVIDQSDRLTQHFDLTFDLSVHDIFVSWINGSCLYVCPNKDTINPTFFVRKHKITIWFSVPSLGVYMQKMKQLKGNVFPSLRQTFFCGEALPVSLVKQWLLAAPNSKIYNLYGPTESTIAILKYKWEDDTSEDECVNGIVPIGKPFRGQSAKIIEGDSYKNNGELHLAGSQVFNGYLASKSTLTSCFKKLSGKNWYKTGDRVSLNSNGNFIYLGRCDRQVKIRGYRVELLEIEHYLKNVSKSLLVAVIPWPRSEQENYTALIGFILKTKINRDCNIAEELSKKLPEYFVPKRIIALEEFPLNSNGKIDYDGLYDFID